MTGLPNKEFGNLSKPLWPILNAFPYLSRKMERKKHQSGSVSCTNTRNRIFSYEATFDNPLFKNDDLLLYCFHLFFIRSVWDLLLQIYRTRPHRSWGLPSLLYDGYGVSFPEVKRPRGRVDHQPLSSAKVKERVELCLYFPSGPS